MPGFLGTIAGQVRLETAQAVAAFAALRASSARTSGAFAAAGSKLTMFGKVSMVAGLALVAAFSIAVKAAADFEKKMDYFGAVNNATAKEMEQVRAKALELGRDTQYSAGQIADAFVEMGKAGVSVKDIVGGLATAIVNLAAAADINLNQATQIVTSQMQVYGLSVKDAAHVTDLLAGAANASIVDVEDLGVSLKYVGGVAHALGISFDSTVTALSLLGKAGIKGSTAGTSLRQIMVSLSGGTKKATDELIDLGIITKNGTNLFFDAHGKAKSLAQIFQILQDHTRGLTQQQQLMAFKTIFNNRALAAAEILTKSGAAGFADMAAQMSKTTAADVAAKRMDNLSGDIKKLKSSIDTLMIQAGTPFQSMLRGIVQGLTKVLNAFINMPSGVQTAILAFIGIMGVILTFLGAVALIGGTVLKAISVFKQMYGAMKLLWVMTKALTVATWEQTVAALSNPYVLIAIAVVALVVAFIALYEKSDKFRAMMDATGRGIKTGFLAAVDWFKTLPKFFEGLWKDISNWFAVGVGWVKKNWDILLAIMLGPVGVLILIWRRFGDSIVNFFQAIPGEVSHFTSAAIAAVLVFVQKLPYYIGYALGFTLGLLVRGLMLMGLAIYNWGAIAVRDTVTFFTQLPGKIALTLTEMYNGFIAFAIAFGVGVKNWAVGAYNDTITWFQKLPGRIVAFFNNLWHSSVNSWNNFNAALIRWLVNTYNSTVTWFQKLPGRVAAFLIDMKNRAVSAFNSLVTASGKFGAGVYNGAMNFINKLPGACWDAINSAIDAFKSMITSAYNAAKGFAKGLWDGFKHGLGIHSPSYIERAMWQITDVTKAETKKLGNHVKIMNALAGTMVETKIGDGAGNMGWAMMAQLAKTYKSQAEARQQIQQALFPGAPSYGAVRTSTSNQAAQEAIGGPGTASGQSVLNVTVNNPIAEQASDSISRKFRTLSAMGAF